MATRDEYEILADKLGFPGSSLLREFLEKALTPRQVKLLAALPGTVAGVAAQTGINEEAAGNDIDDLYRRAAVFPIGGPANARVFSTHRNGGEFVISMLGNQNLDLNRDQALLQAAYRFSEAESQPRYAEEMATASSPEIRIVPAYQSIKDLPGILPHENFHEMLKAQAVIAVKPCPCRMLFRGSGDRCRHGDESVSYHCLSFGLLAKWVARSGVGKGLDIDEALALSDAAERDGLLHDWLDHDGLTGVDASCQCCSHCQPHLTLKEAGLPYGKRWTKSRYEAYVHEAAECDGCQDCLKRCYFEAIEMVKTAGTEQRKAVVDAEKCFGCGLCVLGCPPQVLKMRVVRPPEFIPSAPAAPTA